MTLNLCMVDPFPKKPHLHLLEMEQLQVCLLGVCPPGRRNHENVNFIEYGKQVLPAPTNLAPHPFQPED